MFLNLWNKVRGYVVIEVTGFSVERFVNLAVHKGIYIWDVVYTQRGVEMKVSIKAFKLLKTCSRKTRCKIKIIHKQGCPFFMFRYRKRKFLMGGLLFVGLVLYILSSFVWLIEIKGNTRVNDDTILSICKEMGLEIGKPKYLVQTKEIESKILNTDSNISWVSVHIKGTKASIDVAETLEKKEILDKSVLCNVVAKKDGLITSIVTISGTPMVKQKDVVRKGDILVKSEIAAIENNVVMSTSYVHAEAEVKAQMYYDIYFKVPFTYEEKQWTGQVKKKYRIKLMGKEFANPFGRMPFENYEQTTAHNQITFGEDYPLPIITYTDTIKEFVYKEQVRNIEQAKELAEKMVNNRIIREFDIEADVVNKEIQYTQEPDGLQIHAIVTTIERIDEKAPLQ